MKLIKNYTFEINTNLKFHWSFLSELVDSFWTRGNPKCNEETRTNKAVPLFCQILMNFWIFCNFFVNSWIFFEIFMIFWIFQDFGYGFFEFFGFSAWGVWNNMTFAKNAIFWSSQNWFLQKCPFLKSKIIFFTYGLFLGYVGMRIPT